MTQDLHLDTHVLVWLYAGEHHRFPDTLRDRLNVDRLCFSPMARLELGYLHEIGKITEPPDKIVAELASSMGLLPDSQPFSRVIAEAERATFTRDPFDRIIVAQALAAGAPLATKDERISAAYPAHTVWE